MFTLLLRSKGVHISEDSFYCNASDSNEKVGYKCKYLVYSISIGWYMHFSDELSRIVFVGLTTIETTNMNENKYDT